MKNILITSGGTKEYIDGVRVLTNISSGKLGALIADTIVMKHPSEKDGIKSFHVHFVYVKGTERPKHEISFKGLQNMTVYEVTDVQSVYDIMEKLVPTMDFVIHPMAVSDFGFSPIHTKLKSNDPEAFIESMRERIYQTPKILSHIKKWNPNCFLISFKFEDGMTKEELFESATQSLDKNGSNIVVANDKSEMKKLGVHKAYFIGRVPTGTTSLGPILFNEVSGKEEIANSIFEIVSRRKNELNDGKTSL